MKGLVDEIARDPEAGARKLVEMCYGRLFAVAYRLSGNAADSEELVFRTIRHGVERIQSLRDEAGLFAWLDKILVNFFRMDVRRKVVSATMPVADPPERCDAEPTAADALAFREDAAAIRAAVAALPPVFREVVVLRYFEDMSVPAMANTLCIPEGSVKSRLSRAKEKLRRTLAGTIGERGASNGVSDARTETEKKWTAGN